MIPANDVQQILVFSLSHAIIIVAPQLSAISIQLLVKFRSEYIGV